MRIFWLGSVFLLLFIVQEKVNATDESSMICDKNTHFIKKNMYRPSHCVHGPSGHRGFRGHRGHRGHRGPKGRKGYTGIGIEGITGNTGHQGLSGPLISNYAAGYSASSQNITAGTTVSVLLPNDQVVPVGILHPVSGDFSQFQILESGTYLFQWYLSFTDSTPGTLVRVRLHNVTTATDITPEDLLTVELFAEVFTGVTGQSAVTVPAGTVMSLTVFNDSSNFIAISTCTFVITQIAL